MNLRKIALVILIAFSLQAFGQATSEKAEGGLTNIQEAPSGRDGVAVSPLPSPSGKYLAVTGENFKGISIVDLDTGKSVAVSDHAGAGFGCEWSPDADILAFRASLGNLKRKHLIGVAHPDGIVETASPLIDSLSLPVWKGKILLFAKWGEDPKLLSAGPESERGDFEGIVLCLPSGQAVSFDNKKNLSNSAEKSSDKVFFLPRYSQDGKAFILHCLDGHIYLGSIGSPGLKDIGEGSSARFARNGSAVIFERTLDDGHAVVSSDLFIYENASGLTYQITNTPDKIERHPAMAEDGHTVFFDLDGRIMRGWLK